MSLSIQTPKSMQWKISGVKVSQLSSMLVYFKKDKGLHLVAK